MAEIRRVRIERLTLTGFSGGQQASVAAAVQKAVTEVAKNAHGATGSTLSAAIERATEAELRKRSLR